MIQLAEGQSDGVSLIGDAILRVDDDCIARALPVGGVVWTADGAPVILDPLSYGLLKFIDGETSLRELADDVSHAWNIPLGLAESYVLKTAEPFLQSKVRTSAPGSDDQPRSVTTVHRDGSRTVETSITVSTEATGSDSIVHLASGDRSVAELIPGDSCLGTKLRNGAEMYQVVFESDGVPFSVRTNDDSTYETLMSQKGTAAVVEPGPVLAFAIRPHDGVAPIRVYDATGQRVGRPRDQVGVLDAIADAVSRHLRNHASTFALRAASLSLRDSPSHGGSAVLLPRSILGLPRLEQAAARVGLSVGSAPIHLITPREVEVGRWDFSHAARRSRKRFWVAGALPFWSGKGSNHPSILMINLLAGQTRLEPRLERERVIGIAIDLSETVPVLHWTPDDVRDSGAADRLCSVALHMLDVVDSTGE